MPVAKVARAGMQIGLQQYAFENRTPRPASASMWGVWASALPWQPSTLVLCSSDMMTSRFRGFT